MPSAPERACFKGEPSLGFTGKPSRCRSYHAE